MNAAATVTVRMLRRKVHRRAHLAHASRLFLSLLLQMSHIAKQSRDCILLLWWDGPPEGRSPCTEGGECRHLVDVKGIVIAE